jgi:hypothetical protein
LYNLRLQVDSQDISYREDDDSASKKGPAFTSVFGGSFISSKATLRIKQEEAKPNFEIRLIEGRDLSSIRCIYASNLQLLGVSDAYVTFKIVRKGSSDEVEAAAKGVKSKPYKKSTSSGNPFWDESLPPLVATDLKTEKLVCSLRSASRLGSDQKVADGYFLLEDLSDTLSKELWIPLFG